MPTTIDVNTLLWISNDLLTIVLLWRGWRQRLLGRYPAFYALLGFFLVSALARGAVFILSGRGSDVYYYTYYITAQLFPILRIAVLYSLLQLLPVPPKAGKSEIIPGLILLVLVSISIYYKLIQQPFTFLFATLCFLAPLVAAFFVVVTQCILRVRDRVTLGVNLKGMLFGIGLMTLLTTFNYERLYILRSRDVYAFLEQFGTFVAQAIWIATMWRLDPPRPQNIATPRE